VIIKRLWLKTAAVRPHSLCSEAAAKSDRDEHVREGQISAACAPRAILGERH